MKEMNYTTNVLLAAAALLSPLLSGLHYWQMKEWRWDRLIESVRYGGVWRIVTSGVIRPVIVLLTAATFVFSGNSLIITAGLLALFLLLVVQVVLKRQPRPVWTQKTIVILVTSLLLNILLLHYIMSSDHVIHWLGLPLLSVLQPVVLSTAWWLVRPLDIAMKKRRFNRARQLRSAHPDLTVIAITGSVGKTTTKHVLAALLKPLGAVATPAFVNSELGVTNWFIHVMSGASPPPVLIVEMGAYRTGEIELMCDIVRPSLSIITYIGQQHLALFGSQAKLIQAKTEIVAALPVDGHAFLNADNAFIEDSIARCTSPHTTVGTGHADLKATDIEETAECLRFSAAGTSYRVPLHGTHNIVNVLLAIAVARHLGVSDHDIQKQLLLVKNPDQTFAVSTTGTYTVMDDSHNSSPSSFAAAIDWASNQPHDHKILICSGLIELGPAFDRIHADLGSQAARVFDDIYCTNAQAAHSLSKGAGKPVPVISSATLPELPADTLIVCEGRIPATLLSRLKNL